MWFALQVDNVLIVYLVFINIKVDTALVCIRVKKINTGLPNTGDKNVNIRLINIDFGLQDSRKARNKLDLYVNQKGRDRFEVDLGYSRWMALLDGDSIHPYARGFYPPPMHADTLSVFLIADF